MKVISIILKTSFAANGTIASLFSATNVDGMIVIRKTKGSATKTTVFCPNIIKLYNNEVVSVDIMDQTAAVYRLDCKSKYCFYLRMFFDLIDVAIVNIHILYSKLGNDISLLNLKIVVAKALIGRYSNRKRFFPTSRQSK